MSKRRTISSTGERLFIRADLWHQSDSGTWTYDATTKYNGSHYTITGIVGSKRKANAMLTRACNAIARAIEAMENP